MATPKRGTKETAPRMVSFVAYVFGDSEKSEPVLPDAKPPARTSYLTVVPEPEDGPKIAA